MICDRIFHKIFQAWYKTKKGNYCFKSILDMISYFLFYYHFIHDHFYFSKQAHNSVTGVTCSQQ